MDFRNCANCNSKFFQTESSNCETGEESSLKFLNTVSTAFENVLLFQNASHEIIQDLKLCYACLQPLHLFCNSKKLFLKLSSQNSKISRMLKGEIRSSAEAQWSNKKFITSEKNIINKYSREYIIADAEFKNEETILPDQQGDRSFGHSPNGVCIEKDIQEGSNIIEYQEKYLKMELDELSEETVAMFSSRTCLLFESIQKEDGNYHKCSDCSRIFLESENLEVHRSLVHAVIQPSFSCSFCSKTFSMRWFFKNHLNACHNGIEIFHHCQICSEKFYSEKDLEDHKLKIHDVRKHPFKCKNCFESFRVVDNLRTHLIKIHKRSKEADAAEKNLKLRAETRAKNQQCCICEKIFDTFVALQKHRAKEHGEKESFECIVCHEKFRSHEKFLNHREIHKKCSECDKTFKNYSRIRAHYRRMHVPTSDVAFICEICGQKRPTYESLQSHYRWHVAVTGPKHFCHICNKSFKLKGHLMEHLRETHLENNKIKRNCPFCDQVFALKENLGLHLRDKHEDRLEFPCKICGRKFFNAKSLSSHSRLHTIQSAYAKKTDGSKKRLKTAKSTGIVNGKLEVMACYSSETFLFTCPVCSKSCDSQTHFFRHLRRLHSLKGYADPNASVSSSIKCQFCDKYFPRKDLLDKHRRRAHKLSKKTPGAAVVRPSYECPHCKNAISDCTFPTFLNHVSRHEIFVIDRAKCKQTKKELTEFYNEQTRELTCTTCKLSLKKQSKFIAHLKTHSNIKIFHDKEKKSTVKFPFECEQCPGRAYPSLELLRTHRQTHKLFRKDRIRKCDICDVTLRSKKYLLIHMQTEHPKLEEDSLSSS